MTEHADYVDFLFHPMAYSIWWVLGAAGVVALMVAWIVAVFVWTLPIEVLRGIPVIRNLTYRVLQRKFERSLADIGRRHDRGELAAGDAFHETSRVFRRFAALRTGLSVREMTLTEIAGSPLAPRMYQVLSATYGGQFDTPDPRGVAAAVDAARQAVATWT